MGSQPLSQDTLGIIGLILLVVPFVAWYMVVSSQYSSATGKTRRVAVLLARTALFLPSYAFLMWLSLINPSAYEGLEILVAVVEAYSFYSIFAVIVTNLGGPVWSSCYDIFHCCWLYVSHVIRLRQ